jgi:ribosomal protein S27E
VIDQDGEAEVTCPECGSYSLGGRFNYGERVVGTHRTRCRNCGQNNAVLVIWSNERKEVVCPECGREWIR